MSNYPTFAATIWGLLIGIALVSVGLISWGIYILVTDAWRHARNKWRHVARKHNSRFDSSSRGWMQ